jgi:CheY-like chemotaxis protein
MDHMMPEMDGIEATKRIREAGYSAPIVALTANAVVGQAEFFLWNGFDAFVSKPIDVRQLNTVLNKYIRDKQPPEVLVEARKQKEIADGAHGGNAVNAASDGSAAHISGNADAAKPDQALLEIFSREAKKALFLFENTVSAIAGATEEELHLLTISAHAMKSALANVGEPSASALALSLEEAGKTRDKARIAAAAQSLINVLRPLTARIDADSESAFARHDEAPEFLREKMEVIRAACAAYDADSADAAIAELEKMSWTKESKEAIAAIANHLLHSDFEEAAAAAEALIAG